MPEIGRPQGSERNPFNKISIGRPEGAPVPKSQKNADHVGDKLNKMAGNEAASGSGVKYVDKKTHNQMGKDEFLKLLTVQLANQDPSNPVDQKKMSSELAQFSQLEQLANMNTKLDKFGTNAPIELKHFGAGFLGKQVLTQGTSIDYKGNGDHVSIPFRLGKLGKNVIMRIMDEKGQTISEIPAENFPKGQNALEWNGKMLDGQNAAKGKYVIKVVAWDENMQKFDGETNAMGTVTGVNFEDGETVFTLDGKKRVFLRDVESFSLPSHNNEQESMKPSLAQKKISAFEGQMGQQ